MAKDRRSRDQKRKAKLTERSKRHPQPEKLAYSGEKYRADFWAYHVYQTERAVYETICLSNRTLTNAQVEAAFVELIKELRAGAPATLPTDAPEVAYASGNEVAYLKWNIRRHWGLLFEEVGPVAGSDLVGILRTLLYSIEAQAWARGAARGYVDFLYHFMQEMSFAPRPLPE